MAEKFAENQFCRACGADVRRGALFCYSCGTAVAPDLAVETEEAKEDGASDFWFRGEIIEEKNDKNSSNHFGKIEKPIDKPADPPISLQPIEKDAGKKVKNLPVAQEPVKLKTAPALRQKNRLSERKKVEFVWEAPENDSNPGFIIVTIILAFFALGVLLLMLYIR
jgi:hypothetical protein